MNFNVVMNECIKSDMSNGWVENPYMDRNDVRIQKWRFELVIEAKVKGMHAMSFS